MSKRIVIPNDNNIIKMPIEEAMPENYLPYAVEVAKDRALPDVRDGLKPVHRRIIYGAYTLKALPDKPYYKSARIVGEILGKYHPHGDSSVYDAMVILAQNFSTRMPIIDGHGNWGSVDGDSAAAMRYTEARLTPIAMEMIRDIDKDIVEMVDNYSSSELEPEVLPSRYPNLLVNGTFGIAVGLATNIPPHNLNEVIDASIGLIDNKEITTKELLEYVKGPDLPTGGIIIGKNSLLEAYETGEGKVALRAKTSIEKLENGRLGIVITEFPYRKNKAKLLQTISDMTADKKHSKVLEQISDIRDESDRTGIRAVIELKKSADSIAADKILKYLFKKTDLQCNLSFNMVAIAEGKPEVMGLKTIITHYVNHQKTIIKKRTERELELCKKRHHIVEGFIKAIGIMDEIIKVIRASRSKKEASENLVSRFNFSKEQAEAILELMLYRLTGLEIVQFEKEYKELDKAIKRLEKILSSEKELLKVIKAELTEIKEKYGDKRRTEIVESDEEGKIELEELIIEEDIIITLSKEGFIKRISLKNYNRSSAKPEDIEYREGDFLKYLIPSNTKATIMLFTDKGTMYKIKGNSIIDAKWKEKGEKLEDLIKGIDLNNEEIIGAFSVENICAQKDYIFITDKGNIKKTELDKFDSNYSKVMALKLKGDEKLSFVTLVDRNREEEFIELKTVKGLHFFIEEPQVEVSSRNNAYVSLIKIPEEDRIVETRLLKEACYNSFYLNIDKKGIISKAEKANRGEYKIYLDKPKKIMFIFEDGKYTVINSTLFNLMDNNTINIYELLNIKEQSKIVNIFALDDKASDINILLVTKNGVVKKIKQKDLEENLSLENCIKFKSEKDKIISTELVEDTKELVIITKKAMALRFSISVINISGVGVLGVTAISLKEDDFVVFSAAVNKDEKGCLSLKSYKKEIKKVPLNSIQLSSRAVRGKNIMLIVLDDYLKEVKITKE